MSVFRLSVLVGGGELSVGRGGERPVGRTVSPAGPSAAEIKALPGTAEVGRRGRIAVRRIATSSAAVAFLDGAAPRHRSEAARARPAAPAV